MLSVLRSTNTIFSFTLFEGLHTHTLQVHKYKVNKKLTFCLFVSLIICGRDTDSIHWSCETKQSKLSADKTSFSPQHMVTSV